MSFNLKVKRTYSSFNKLTVNYVEYGCGGVVHTAGEIGEKYTEASPTNKSPVKVDSRKVLQNNLRPSD